MGTVEGKTASRSHGAHTMPQRIPGLPCSFPVQEKGLVHLTFPGSPFVKSKGSWGRAAPGSQAPRFLRLQRRKSLHTPMPRAQRKKHGHLIRHRHHPQGVSRVPLCHVQTRPNKAGYDPAG